MKKFNLLKINFPSDSNQTHFENELDNMGVLHRRQGRFTLVENCPMQVVEEVMPQWGAWVAKDDD